MANKTDTTEYISKHATNNKINPIPNSKTRKKLVKKNRLRLLPFCILIIFFASIMFICLYKIFFWYKDNVKIKKINDDIKDEVKINEANTEGEFVNPEADKKSDYWYYVDLPFYEVDFTNLLTKNSDTVAFIHMKNTNINYPVVQSKDNSYYLNHAFDKSYNKAGWVFMDYRNNINSLNDNTIIYGHGRLDKTVFGSLKNVLSVNWQKNKDNYVIWLSTPNENMMFQIFSIYTIQSEGYYIETSFESRASKETWLNTMKQRNTAPINTPVDINDKILTLSTCLNNNGDRIVVQAKLIKRQVR